MHIVVVGAGALGTLYGGWLVAGGGNVSFVARGTRNRQMRDCGITLQGQGKSSHLSELTVAARAEELPHADVLLFCVKLYDLAEAASESRAALVDGGLVVGLQNGVAAAGILETVFPPDDVMVGPAYSAARLDAKGVVHFSGTRKDVIIGNSTGRVHPSAEKLLSLWRNAGVAGSIGENIGCTLWSKFLAFGTNAALTCLSRQSAGTIYHDDDLLGVARGSIAEIAAVAAAEGIDLPATAPAEALTLLQGLPPEMVASMRQDLDAGRRLELDGISGAIVRMGRKHGISTPFHETAYACLKPFRDGAPQGRSS